MTTHERTAEDQLWYELHMASGQVPMVYIRQLFRQEGFELVRGHGTYGVWNRLEDTFNRQYVDTESRSRWEAFRRTAEHLGYSPARQVPEAQEGQGRGPGRQEEPAPRAEARSRMATTGWWVRWQSVGTGGFVFPPQYEGDVGMDLAAIEETLAEPGKVTYVPTGVAFAAPAGYWILLVGRSSLASKLGLACVPGVIDNGFRGEMLAGVYPIGTDPVRIPRGTRLVQAILMPVVQPVPEQVNWLPPSDRGENGFGSTGGHTDGE